MTDTTDSNSEDEGIFSQEEISLHAPAKGNRLIPTWLMGDFVSWLARYYPEIRMLRGIPLQRLEELIDEFEYFSDCSYDFTMKEWQQSLDQLS